MNVTRPPADQQTLEQKVNIVCLREQYRKSALPAFGISSVALLCAVPAWFYMSHSLVIAYVCVMIGYQIFTFALSQWVYRQKRYGLSLFQVSAIAIFIHNGVLIGVTCVVLYRVGGEPMFVFVVLALLGLASGSLGTAAYHAPSMFVFLLTCMPIFIVDLLLHERTFTENVVCVGLVFDLAYVMVMGWQQSQSIRSATRLRLEREQLLEQLKSQTEIAETARAKAVFAGEQQSRFFASASHDLRQPVHALNVYASLLKTTELERERVELVDRVNSCVDTLSDLFNALLTVSRAESIDQENMTRVPVSLQGAISSAVTQFTALAGEKDIELRHAPTRLWVQGDRVAISRMIGNLIANAIRFTPHGKVLVGVRRRGEHVELQVLDTGVGIDEENGKRIFDPFYQVGNPGRRADRGFGLGLVIVYRLCDALNYSIKVNSIPGRGSVFSIAMPLVQAPEQQPEMPSLADSGAKFGQTIRLLFVDDDPLVRDAMARVFQGWGVDADMCASSAEAFALARDHGARWHCLLLDQRLDEAITGLELAEQLRALLHRPIPVALLTGEDPGEWTFEAQAHGYTVLPKPVRMIRLRAYLAASRATTRPKS